MTDPVVAVRGLRMAYGDVVVLEDVDLLVRRGEIVAITGINGVGKSTLLSCLAGFRRAAAGTVTVLGGPPRDNAAFWRAVAHVADQPTWYPGLTVREHLELVRMTHEPVAGWCLEPDELIESFGLTARADASPLSLSSGQRQRLSLAAALARPSDLLLLDEPEQSLDVGFRTELAHLLRGYTGNGGTVIMATHDHDFADAAGARQVPLTDGRIDTGHAAGPEDEYAADEDPADEGADGEDPADEGADGEDPEAEGAADTGGDAEDADTADADLDTGGEGTAEAAPGSVTGPRQ